MEHMRDQRKRLLKKIKDSKRSGTSTDDIFKPAVWWFDFVSFLDPDLKGRVTTDNLSQVSVDYHFRPIVGLGICHRICLLSVWRPLP